MTIKEKTCCFTGHRVIAPVHREAVARRLEQQIRQLIQDGICDFIAGGARGFDTLAAETVLDLRREFPHIRLILALPCRDQTRGWGLGEKQQYERIVARADLVHYLAETYDSGCMMRRNRFMVDHSTACIFYLTRMRSGTYKTVEYAMEQGHTLYNILCED
ncbi:MAG: SLOG family protein [Clostridia bacterium]|nr:SLOG family protein [Clostridia bacterium]